MTDTAGRLVRDAGELLGRMLNDSEKKNDPGRLYVSGPMEIPLPHPRVSVIGSRRASKQGLDEAKRITETLTDSGAIIVSGLARGIDTMAHKTCMGHGGKTIAVIGTPLDRTYPRENRELQQEMMKNHLVVSQYRTGHATKSRDFALRNKTMALISDATVIVEAGDRSGSLYHGWAALSMGRPLFICTATESGLSWPDKMTRQGAMVLDDPRDILEHVPSDIDVPGLS